jgi:hypothetical protein
VRYDVNALRHLDSFDMAASPVLASTIWIPEIDRYVN